MGIESLETAARAAGFAMAADEPLVERQAVSPADGPWRPGTVALQEQEFPETADAKLVDRANATFTDWVKGMVGVTGRGAPA